jgi:feruloyl esterase
LKANNRGLGQTGEGAWIFGAASQRNTAPPLENNSKYDIQAAMVEWLETNRTVDHIVATKYRNDSASSGVSFTRKLCPVSDEDCRALVLC